MPAFHHFLEIQISYTFKFCDKSLRMFLFFSFSPVAVHQHWLFKERRRVPLNIYSIFLCPLVCSSVSKSARYIHATSPISHKPRNLFHCLQCTMCCLGSTIALYPKTEIQKPLSHGKKLFLRLFFLCSFRMKTLKLVSLFIFRHWKHYFWSTQNREK